MRSGVPAFGVMVTMPSPSRVNVLGPTAVVPERHSQSAEGFGDLVGVGLDKIVERHAFDRVLAAGGERSDRFVRIFETDVGKDAVRVLRAGCRRCQRDATASEVLFVAVAPLVLVPFAVEAADKVLRIVIRAPL